MIDEGVSTEPSEATESNFTINETTPEPIMEQPTKVIMTHMYVMQERKNSTTESNTRSNEIQVNIQPEMSSVSTPNPLDLIVATESINDNIIFDTKEIFPVKAPEEDVTEGNANVGAVSNIEDPKSSLDEIRDHDGTSYRTEK